MQAAQEWLLERLEGLVPGDFEEGTRMISAMPFRPPEQFQSVWIEVSSVLTLTREECDKMHAIVIFGDPYDQVALRFVLSLLERIDADAPPILWAGHTTKPSSKPNGIRRDSPGSPMITNLLESGLDGFILEEPAGLHLALAIRAKIHKAKYVVEQMNGLLRERLGSERLWRIRYAEHLQDSIHSMLWGYLRKKRAASIPSIDHGLPAGEPRYLPGYKVGKILGEGTCGRVYKLHRRLGVCNEVEKPSKSQQ
jgi:hypothetical protein